MPEKPAPSIVSFETTARWPPREVATMASFPDPEKCTPLIESWVPAAVTPDIVALMPCWPMVLKFALPGAEPITETTVETAVTPSELVESMLLSFRVTGAP